MRSVKLPQTIPCGFLWDQGFLPIDPLIAASFGGTVVSWSAGDRPRNTGRIPEAFYPRALLLLDGWDPEEGWVDYFSF